MKRTITFALLLAGPAATWAQQVLFAEDFEGSTHGFTLNTTHMASTPGGENFWMVGSSYTGGQGSISCFGIPFSYTIPNTPQQPAGISNADGNYLHIASQAGFSSGITNANFAAADGLCTSEANHFAAMTSDVSTVDADEVTLSFWWLCAGSSSNYGEVYYSTDAGTSWNLVSAPNPKYYNQNSWTQQTIALAAFAGQASLRFGFRFVNQISLLASDPGFALDDVTIEANMDEPLPTELLTGALDYDTYCPGSAINVPYTATGTWGASNIFTAELSDATGSFAAPVALGSLQATASGTIAGVIPEDTPLGTGYQVRVVGSAPAGTGTISVTAITIVEAPYAGASTHIDFCRTNEPVELIELLPGASDCGEWTYNGQPIAGTIDPATAQDGSYVYTTNCAGGCPQDQAQVTIMFIEPASAGVDTEILVCAQGGMVELFDMLDGEPQAGGSWTFGVEPVSGSFDPAASGEGCYTYTVPGSLPCPEATAAVCVAVDPCLGVEERAGSSAWHWLGQQGSLHIFTAGNLRPESVELFDGMGRKQAAHVEWQGERMLLDLAGMPTGIYALRATCNGVPITSKLFNGR